MSFGRMLRGACVWHSQQQMYPALHLEYSMISCLSAGVWADTPVEPPRVQALLSAQPTAHQPPTSGNTPPGYVHTGVDRWVPPSVAHAMAHAQAHAPQHAPHVQTQSHGPIHGDRWQPSSSQQQQQEQERWLHPGPDRCVLFAM